ncbi:MAG: heme exporter protein CcmD [Candidatus Pelagibacter sp.]|nr:heme exporter protein CcmD [Candidatus Pelagibacter sp.]|tara:strand:+ start:799 stop:1026 length:228 start_codon:yes stop_codon:yes gene_type:complete
MINEFISMNGYGLFVWSAYLITLFGFTSLYLIIKLEQIKEKRKFVSKFSLLDSEKATGVETNIINQEILSITTKI